MMMILREYLIIMKKVYRLGSSALCTILT